MPSGDRYCSACGARLTPGDRFCSQCGNGVDTGGSAGGSASSGSSLDADRAWLRRRVEDYRVRGWTLEHDHGDRVVLVDRGFGSLPVHFVLLLLTGGVGNVLYAWYRHTSGAPRREIRADGSERSYPDDARLGVDPWMAAGAVLGFLFVVTAALTFAAGAASAASGPLVLVTGVLFLAIALGVTYFPLAARQGNVPLSTVGRKRTVSTDRVRNPPEPCAACGDRVRSGVRRAYADRWYLAGLPLRTYESGENVYCRECFEGESDTDGPDVEAELDESTETERA
ncbi:zinc ribbon domain-containing protein [Halorarum halophilum]|uniref:Zinc ribbon domain-containing protein n=1 Tax=Halorarum halophilum TaxID=2743090 RepID=A0A7D5GB39_9EURY|nr:zinc ribbon domain-containing protein [Halobaculum halophilum]QLG27025.1 zinc ribbon domain-containing protein [Halobaculum halophilum]